MIFNRVWRWMKHWPMHIVTSLLACAVLVIAPQQFGLLIYKSCLIFGAAIMAYWINRAMFGRKDGVETTQTGNEKNIDVQGQWQLVAMICGAMLAAGLAA